MTAVTDNRNDHLLIFSIASENVLEAVAQVVKVSVLADLGLENARLHALSRLRARQVEAAKATTILLEVANLLRSGENIKRRLVPLHHGTTANRRSCLPNTTSQQLSATSVLFIDELAIVIVVLARDHALIVDCKRWRSAREEQRINLPKRRLLEERNSSRIVQLKRPLGVLSF